MSLERADSRNGLQREIGTVQLVSVSTLGLLEVFDREIAFARRSEDGETKPANCPTSIPARYLARRGEWKIPTLRGVIESPILRPDGTILRSAGYDDATGLFLHSELDWSDLPEPGGLADAQKALHVLNEPFSEFPFIDEAAKSVFLTCILTALQRRLLASAPLFGFTAPDKRSGKSMLAESVGIIALGRKPPAAGVSTQQDEFRKAITSSLREGHLIVNLDNIIQPLGSPDLARAITQSIYEDRLLGANQMLRLPTNVLWTATGNNLTFKGDLPSRALLCGIDAEVERPEERKFKIVDLSAYLHQHRKELVVAALTILRAYELAGRPRQNLKPWGGFNHWSQSIREPLVWLGLADPCQTREQIIASDPERELNAEVLSSWYEVFGDREIKVHELIRELPGTGDANIALRQAVLIAAADRKLPNTIDPRRLGSWCRTNEGRIVNGFRIKRTGEYRRAITWRVSRVSCVSPNSVGRDENCSDNPPKGGVAAEYIVDRPETDSHNSPDSHSEKRDEEGVEV